jgi:predicted RNA-binding Zn-ribbon protein involved in translation (DUF1610 family)
MDDLDRLYHRLLDAVREGAPHLRERRFRLGDIPQHLLPYRLHRRELGFESVQQYERALARLAAGERGYLSADSAVHDAFRQAAGSAGPSTAPLEHLLRTHGDASVALAPDSRHRPDDAPRATPAGAGLAASEAGMPGAGVPTGATMEASMGGGTPAAGVPRAPAPAADAPGGAPVIPIVRTNGADVAPPVGMSAAPQPGTPAAASSPAAGRAAEPPTAPMPFPVRPPTPVLGGTCPHCGRPLPTDRGVTFCPYCGENLTVRRCPACSTELEAGWRFCITCGREVDAPAGVGSS